MDSERLASFVENGWAIIPGAHDRRWIDTMRARFPVLRERQPSANGWKHFMIADVVEAEPELCIEAAMKPAVLDFAELLIGPHVQLESVTFAGFAPDPAAADPQRVSGWHRDLFACYPQEGHYQRPTLFNAMVYLQDLTDEIGPLRVIAGSHRRAMTVAPGSQDRRHPEEVVLYPQAGDAVVFHHALLHSGSLNRGTDTRYFFATTYNHQWMKFRANYSGPACQAVIRIARERGDRRLLRLLGVDDQLWDRAGDWAMQPDEARWERWRAEDRAALVTRS